MAVVRKRIAASRDEIFAVLTTPETYPTWLIGCRTIRAVDDDWPAPGSKFHHRVGIVGPLTVADHTKVLAMEPGRLLSLEVRARPFGRGRATFTLTGGATAGTTEVSLDEVPIGALSPTTPLANPIISVRNVRSLEKLAELLADARG